MLGIILSVGLCLMVLERLIPDQALQKVDGWWLRVIIVNVLQLGVVLLADLAWNQWFGFNILNLRGHFSPPAAAFLTYLILTFVFYWWHRWRHDVNVLWLSCHQLHHSASRIETITSFYKHPVELVINGIIIAAVNFGLCGLTIEGAAWVTLYTALAEFFYHMNIKTPRWVGYIIQRPEMHRIHHKRGFHYNNFADLPIWDMLFGTFENPADVSSACGFKPEREVRFRDILLFKNVNNPFPFIIRKGTSQ
jgi:sterol desaturase/sphingolipid hydroxylase (fatty acid hydroxylase superfamily)